MTQIISTLGRPLVDMTGLIVGDLTIIKQGAEYRTSGGHTKTRWICRCKCGKEILLKVDKLRSKNPPMSCGCRRMKTIEGRLYVWKRYEANRRELQFSLTLEEFSALVLQNCHYCDKPPSNLFKSKKESIQYSGLDRKHNDQGYLSGNCLPCCSHCNSMKLDMSYEDFLEKIHLLYKRLCV
jgi:hypothetical protein